MNETRQTPGWLARLWSTPGIGWIGFLVLVAAVVAGVFVLGGDPPGGKNTTAQVPGSQSTR